MGLDQVEMIIRTEENFGISFDDKELAQIRTVGELFQLIVTKLMPNGSTVCLTSHTFYRIRKEIVSKFGLTRSTLKPATLMNTILPKDSRYLHWKSLGTSLGLKLPTLIRPKWMDRTFGMSILIMIVCAVILGITGTVHLIVAWILGFSAIPLFILEYKLTEKWQIVFPKQIDDLEKLTRMVLQRNFSIISSEVKSWNEKEVYESLVMQLVDQFGIPAEKINLNSRIVPDLGID